MLQEIFELASTSKFMQTEHANQLWQALFVLTHDCPEAVSEVSPTFKKWLKEKWREEKARTKTSSARHKALSETLNFMGIPHFNEHDEDIDVAIILGSGNSKVAGRRKTLLLNDEERSKIALEFDGPSHFVRGGRRPLGDTMLKYRLLKHQGWDVVRVPYYEFDKIPFWASMERQRYLQRVLKTRKIRFSEIDVSEYSKMPDNRKTRFD
uniref:RAP domain-containing protein n=1 Tax=Leptocylindrus danicus TaxID=163516 RepID=A0A6U2QF35_9STRA